MRLFFVLTLALCLSLLPGFAAPLVMSKEEGMQIPVTLSLKRASLSSVLAQINTNMGKTLKLESRIADKPVTLFVKSVPLGETLDALADALDYGWSKTQKGEYFLYLPSKLAEQAKDARQANQQRLLKWLNEEAQISTDWLNQSYPEVKKNAPGLKAGSTTKETRKRDRFQRAAQLEYYLGGWLFSKLTPRQRQQLVEGQLYSASTYEGGGFKIPEPVAQWALEAYQFDLSAPGKLEMTVVLEPFQNTFRCTLEVTRSGENREERILKSAYWPLEEAPKNAPKPFKPNLSSIKSGFELLRQEVKPFDEPMTYADVLEQIASQTKYNLISDDYWLDQTLEASAENLRDLLIRVSSAQNVQFEKKEAFLLGKHLDRFNLEAREISPKTIGKLNKKTFSLEELSLLAQLSPAQIENLKTNPLALHGEVQSRPEWFELQNLEALLFYASLNASQRRSLKSGGLKLLDLNALQQQAYLRTFNFNSSNSLSLSLQQAALLRVNLDLKEGQEARFEFFVRDERYKTLSFDLSAPQAVERVQR